jgi:hypothetical protein
MLAALLVLVALTIGSQPHVTAILCYFATVMVFVAYPRIRAADLAASAVVIIALLCFAEAAKTGILLPIRFALAMAAIGAAVLPFKLSRIRRLAGYNGYRTLSDYQANERRRGDASAPESSPSSMPSLLLLPTARP